MRNIENILKDMTMEEKLGQLAQYNANLFLNSDADITGPLTELGLTTEELKNVGSVLNFRSAQEVCDIQKQHMETDRNKIPMLFMMDVIHGYRTIYPIPLGLGCSFDTGLVTECTRMASREATAAGVHVTFTPMVDFVRDARWGRVMETCGEDALVNSRMGAAQVRAFQGESLKDKSTMATCVKHYAAYGGAEAGRDYNQVELSEHSLREFYLPAYKACLDAGAEMLMPAFNTLNGVPCVANPWLMQTVLREDWNHDPLVISDYNAIGELCKHGVAENMKQATKLAFENGCHIEMCSSGYIKHLKELVQEGVFSEEQVDNACRKVLQLKEKLGLFEDPYRGCTPEGEAKAMLTPENRALVRKAARECAVLLKNEGVLPLSGKEKKIALIGPMASTQALKGFWACQGRDEETVSVEEGMRNALPDTHIVAVPGCGNTCKDLDMSGFAEAVEAAKEADAVILCLGEPQNYSGEGNSRAELELPGVQNELAEAVIRANPNTVVVLFSGRPLVLTRLADQAKAMLAMWFPGTEAGNAVADLLLGKANPCGKLTMTFPAAVGQCPIYYNHTRTGRPKPADKDSMHMPYTSNYIECGNLPLYSFGHGLSYSKFEYEGLTLSADSFTAGEKVTATVTVRNVSDRPGKETVMLYMQDVVASNARPIQQLMDFVKVELAPGECREVTFTVTEEQLRFWNNAHQFVSEPGLFRISTGYADHLLHTKELTLK